MNGKPRIVWIPGWGCTEEALQPLIKALPGGFDHRIFGWNEALRGLDNLKNMVDNKFFPDAAQGPVILAGWSLGGMIALRAAMARPGAAAALILISSTGQFVNAANHPGTDARLRAMRRKLQRQHGIKPVLSDFFTASLFPLADPFSVSSLTDRAAATFNANELILGLDYLASENLSLPIVKINIPTLKIHGSDDRIIAPLNAASNHPIFANLASHSIPMQGHMLPLTARPELTEFIAHFLENQCL